MGSVRNSIKRHLKVSSLIEDVFVAAVVEAGIRELNYMEQSAQRVADIDPIYVVVCGDPYVRRIRAWIARRWKHMRTYAEADGSRPDNHLISSKAPCSWMYAASLMRERQSKVWAAL